MLAYENELLMARIRHALRTDLREGEVLIFRAPFRWKLDTGAGVGLVLPNHYESMSIDNLVDDFGYEVREHFTHAFIAVPRRGSHAWRYAKEVA